MPKRKRYALTSKSIPIEANSLGNLSHGHAHSEPLAQSGTSLHHIGQTDPSPQPIVQANTTTDTIELAGTSTHPANEAPSSIEPEAPASIEPEAQNAPSDGYGKKSTKYWIVELEGICFT